MATSNIAFPINLRQNQNTYNNGYGKYYAEVDTKEPLNLKGFAKHISDHGKLVTYDLAQLVLNNIVSCLKELITQGQPVKLDGFGTFAPYVENDGKKAKTTVEATLEQGLDVLVSGIHIRFIPENSKGEKLTSRALKEECVLQAAYVVSSLKKTINGKVVTYQEKIPISSYATAMASTGTSGGGTNDGPNSGDDDEGPSGEG